MSKKLSRYPSTNQLHLVINHEERSLCSFVHLKLINTRESSMALDEKETEKDDSHFSFQARRPENFSSDIFQDGQLHENLEVEDHH